MDDPLKIWIESTLINHHEFTPEKCGAKRLIHANHYRAPLASVFIDSPPIVAPLWSASKGETFTESLFTRLKPAILRYECKWFFISSPQNEYTFLRWIAPFKEETWDPSRLFLFENTSAECGAQRLVLLIGARRELLVFELNDGLEIAFYGTDLLWQEMFSLLRETQPL